MRSRTNRSMTVSAAILMHLFAADVLAQNLFQPPGANLTYGDVTHGMRIQSASTNPAAAAADLAARDGGRGMLVV